MRFLAPFDAVFRELLESLAVTGHSGLVLGLMYSLTSDIKIYLLL